MTRTQLNHQVARITGEPIGNITALGFSLLRPSSESMEPEDIRLVLECPFCGRPVPYPGLAADGSEPIAECERFDVDFDFLPLEVHDIPVERPRCPSVPWPTAARRAWSPACECIARTRAGSTRR
jgi:hypothetical protein